MTSTDDADICLIQELYINFLHLTSATPHWTVFYPTWHSTHPNKTRTIILISNKMSSDSIQQITVDSSDIVAILTETDMGTLDIYNIYLDCKHSLVLIPLTRAIATQKRVVSQGASEHMILAGDFNHHHPLWDKDCNRHLFMTLNLQIIELQVQLNLVQALPKGIPTLVVSYSGNYTRTDNIFVSETLIIHIVTCAVLPEQQHIKSDHIPILTTFGTKTQKTEPHSRHNYKKVDWDELRKTLKS